MKTICQIVLAAAIAGLLSSPASANNGKSFSAEKCNEIYALYWKAVSSASAGRHGRDASLEFITSNAFLAAEIRALALSGNCNPHDFIEAALNQVKR